MTERHLKPRMREKLTMEPLAKLQWCEEFSPAMMGYARRPQLVRVGCFSDESPYRSGHGHASARDAIKHLGSHSRISFPDATGGSRAAHGATRAACHCSQCRKGRGIRADVVGAAGPTARRPACAGAGVRREGGTEFADNGEPDRAACRRCHAAPALRLGTRQPGSKREHVFASLR